MIKRIERRVCDHCGKVTEVIIGHHFGGSPFSGWFTLARTDRITVVPRKDNGPWDFCSSGCLLSFLSE